MKIHPTFSQNVNSMRCGTRRFLWRIWAAAIVLSVAGVCSSAAYGADSAFVGVLAIAVDAEGAKALELSPDVQRQLVELVDRRENEAVEVALEAKDLTPAERAAKLAPFVAESEKLGLALLTPEQQKKLQKLRVMRAGMASLSEDAIATRLGLSVDQRAQVRKLLDQRAIDMTRGGEQERRLTHAKFERELSGVLSKLQKGAWEQLAGLASGEPPVVVVEANDVSKSPEKTAEADTVEPPANPSTRSGPSSRTPPLSVAGNKAGGSDSRRTATDSETKLRFAFRYAPWKEVLDWFAQQANLSLVLDAPPPGTFNYTDTRAYTPSEAIDLLNSVLLTKGYTLMRRERMLMLFNLEDEIPEPLVELVLPEDLDARGKYELVKCLFPLKKMSPEDAEKELNKLIGPAGKVSVLPQAKQILVRETAAKLRAIRDLIDAVENPDAKKEEKLTVIKLEHMLPDDFLMTARPLLGLPEGLNSAPDGSLRISLDLAGSRLLVAGRAERVQKLEEIHKLLDVDTGAKVALGPVETPQLEIYSVAGSDPAAVLQVMQTLLAGLPDVRLATDPKTGNLIAMARPSQHSTIRETLKQMQRDASEVEVVTLRRVDPQTAVVAINKLFGGDEKGAGAGAPKVESDSATRQLFLRGTPTQVKQVRSLLEKMGEGDAALAAEQTEQGNVRILPLTGRAARSVLEQAEALWPTLHKNRIRVVSPSSSTIPAIRSQGTTPASNVPEPEPEAERAPPSPKTSAKPATAHWRSLPAQFVVFGPVAQAEEKATSSEAKSGKKGSNENTPQEAPEIIVSFGPAGIVIASEDKEALNQFETLLRALADRSATSGREYTVYYLKFAKADAAAALLNDILSGGGGGAAAPAGGGGGSLLGDLATGMLGDVGGGLLGGLLGGGGAGGAGMASGTVSIVPDARLNALIVHATSADLDMVEQLLKVIDQESGPEDVQTAGKPRFLPVFNTSAEEIATVVRQVYAGRIAADAAQGGQQRQPSPEEFIRALRGGGGGGRGQGGKNEAKMEPAKLTLGVDTRSNAIIVTAPDPLFQEVKTLVTQLDHAAEANRDESMRVVTIKQANPQLIQRAVTAMVGSQVKSSTTSSRPGGPSAGGPGPGGGSFEGGFQGQSDQARDQFRQRMEFFNEIQRQGGGGSSRSGGSSRGSGGGTSGRSSRGGGR